ncbi:hypothetical protein RIF29_22621 [Crotalaria pallida]|uniref:Uncharacterized protein n=1 Tax=Crotalaria pallida TaxID=3830 RepID=A0AAN9F4L8_CROPI
MTAKTEYSSRIVGSEAHHIATIVMVSFRTNESAAESQLSSTALNWTEPGKEILGQVLNDDGVENVLK